VTKMHHCLMDGASGANQIANLLDLTPETPPLTPPAPWSPPGLPRPAELLRGPYSSGLVHPVALGSAVTATARGMWSRLRVQLEAAFGRESVPSLFDRAPATPFNGAITPHRVAAFASLSLEDVKLVKNTFRVTVNDVVLAACACALRKHLRSRDGLPEGPLVCGCPVSTKSGEEVGEFSNKLSVMTVRLPTDLEAPEDVLEAVHRDAEAAKRALGVVEDDLAGAWFDLVPPGLAGVATRLFSDLGLADWVPAFVNLIISNVAGPPLPLYLAGARVDAIYPMGPIGEGVGLNITVLSNVDRIDIGVLGCRELVPGIDDIAADVVAAVEQLKETAKTRQAA